MFSVVSEAMKPIYNHNLGAITLQIWKQGYEKEDYYECAVCQCSFKLIAKSIAGTFKPR